MHIEILVEELSGKKALDDLVTKLIYERCRRCEQTNPIDESAQTT